jgi:hypothetical protein
MAYSDTRLGRYEFLKSGYSAELILDRTDRWVNFSGLKPKKRQPWRMLITNLAATLLSFSTPTQSHSSSNHNNGYGRPKAALVQS